MVNRTCANFPYFCLDRRWGNYKGAKFFRKSTPLFESKAKWSKDKVTKLPPMTT